MLGGTYLLTKLLLPALEKTASTAEPPSPETTSATAAGSVSGVGRAEARVINVSSGGMYTVSAAGIADDIDSEGVKPYNGTIV